MKFVCSNCGQHLEAEEDQVGMQFDCPSCGSPISAPIQPTIEPNREPESSLKTEHTKLPSEEKRQADDFDDKEKLWGLRVALLVMPIYMFTLVIYYVGFCFDSKLLNQGTIKIAWIPLVLMAGIAFTSLRCLRWIHTDRYRAAAIGKKLFLLYIVISTLAMVIADWPTDKFEGPTSAFYEERIEANYKGQMKELHLVDLDEITLVKANFWSWLSYLFDVIETLMGEVAIYAFVSLICRKLKGTRAEFNWSNFIHEVSFGNEKWGEKYEWDPQ